MTSKGIRPSPGRRLTGLRGRYGAVLATLGLCAASSCDLEVAENKLPLLSSANCERVLACAETHECPPGLLCADLPASEDAALWPESVGDAPACMQSRPQFLSKTCQLPRGRSRRDVLLNGFQVSAFELTPADDDKGGAAAFRWDAVQGARFVHCALFACEPVVRQTGAFGAYPTFEIANALACVLAHDVLSAEGGLFDLGNQALELTSTAWVGFPAAIYAGCWAFNEARIVSATSLEPVPLGRVSNYRSIRDDACTAAGRACARSDGSSGVCGPELDGGGDRCRRPCMSASDCTGTLFSSSKDVVEPDGGGGAPAAGGAGGEAGEAEMPEASAPRCIWPAQDFVGYCEEE